MKRSYLITKILFEELCFTYSISDEKVISIIGSSPSDLELVRTGRRFLQIGELLAIVDSRQIGYNKFFSHVTTLKHRTEKYPLELIEKLYEDFLGERIDWYCTCGVLDKLNGSDQYIRDSKAAKLTIENFKLIKEVLDDK